MCFRMDFAMVDHNRDTENGREEGVLREAFSLFFQALYSLGKQLLWERCARNGWLNSEVSRSETMSGKFRHLVSERLHSFLGRTDNPVYILPGGK